MVTSVQGGKVSLLLAVSPERIMGNCTLILLQLCSILQFLFNDRVLLL